jgi:hypothetical protein
VTFYQPIFVTRQALRIAAVRRLLADTGITADLQTVHPEQMERIVTAEADWLVIVDGQAMPHPDAFERMRLRRRRTPFCGFAAASGCCASTRIQEKRSHPVRIG